MAESFPNAAELLRELFLSGAHFSEPGDDPTKASSTLVPNATSEPRAVGDLRAIVRAIASEIDVVARNAAVARGDAEALALEPAALAALIADIDALELEKRVSLEAELVVADGALEFVMTEGAALRDELVALGSSEAPPDLAARSVAVLSRAAAVPRFPSTQSLIKVVASRVSTEDSSVDPASDPVQRHRVIGFALGPSDLHITGAAAGIRRRRVVAGTTVKITVSLSPAAALRVRRDGVEAEALALLLERTDVLALLPRSGGDAGRLSHASHSRLCYRVSPVESDGRLQAGAVPRGVGSVLGGSGASTTAPLPLAPISVIVSLPIPTETPLDVVIVLRSITISGIDVPFVGDCIELVVAPTAGISPDSVFPCSGSPVRQSFGPTPAVTVDGSVYAVMDDFSVGHFSNECQLLRSVPRGTFGPTAKPNAIAVNEELSLLLVAVNYGETPLIALDLASLEPRWKSEVGHNVFGAYGVACLTAQDVVFVTAHSPDEVHAFRLSDGVHLHKVHVSCPVYAVADTSSDTVYVSGWDEDDELFMLQWDAEASSIVIRGHSPTSQWTWDGASGVHCALAVMPSAAGRDGPAHLVLAPSTKNRLVVLELPSLRLKGTIALTPRDQEFECPVSIVGLAAAPTSDALLVVDRTSSDTFAVSWPLNVEGPDAPKPSEI